MIDKIDYKQQLEQLIDNILKTSYATDWPVGAKYRCCWCYEGSHASTKYIRHRKNCPAGLVENAFDGMFGM